MKLFIDAHLPAVLAEYFEGHDVLHTSFLPEGNLTKDSTIASISVLEDRALITKDLDFYYTYIASKKPPKLVLVKLGNIRLRELRLYFEKNAATIIELLTAHSLIVLERDKIRVME